MVYTAKWLILYNTKPTLYVRTWNICWLRAWIQWTRPTTPPTTRRRHDGRVYNRELFLLFGRVPGFQGLQFFLRYECGMEELSQQFSSSFIQLLGEQMEQGNDISNWLNRAQDQKSVFTMFFVLAEHPKNPFPSDFGNTTYIHLTSDFGLEIEVCNLITWHPGWWQPEIRRENPLVLGSLSRYLQGFSTIPGGSLGYKTPINNGIVIYHHLPTCYLSTGAVSIGIWKVVGADPTRCASPGSAENLPPGGGFYIICFILGSVLLARWWQLKDFLFSPRTIGESFQYDDHHFFQIGWSHQL